jgi:uncharacterized membrane protein YgcG
VCSEKPNIPQIHILIYQILYISNDYIISNNNTRDGNHTQVEGCTEPAALPHPPSNFQTPILCIVLFNGIFNAGGGASGGPSGGVFRQGGGEEGGARGGDEGGHQHGR